MLDVRLLHHLEELARIGRQALYVAALALSVDGIEGEAALPRSRQPGDDGQGFARDIDIDPFEIVLPGTAHADVSQHAPRPCFGI